tara:strand:- start:40 stop:402 length:363 start_codon:yes stop_codon:yes gene_type:complete
MVVYVIRTVGEAPGDPIPFPYTATGCRRDAERLFREACLRVLPGAAWEVAPLSVHLYKTTLPNISKKKLVIALLSDTFPLGDEIKSLSSGAVSDTANALSAAEDDDYDFQRATLKALREA